MKTIKVNLKGRSYNIVIGRGLLKDCGAFLKKLRIGSDAVIITNRRLLALYGNDLSRSLRKHGLTARFELVPDSEKAKSASVATRLIDNISVYDKRKAIFIIAFGGGVVGDLAGFVASIYKRGVPYVQIPTTLLAQVDSAIGGKVAIDLSVAKNLVGAFYQPRLVLSDVSLLRTLPARQVRNGLAEVVKYGVIKDRELFEFLEARPMDVLRRSPAALEFIVTRSSSIKARLVARDEFDRKGVRAVLNFGHTLGHAIESASSYSGRYNHGEAIAVGMILASQIALRLAMIKPAEVDRIAGLIAGIGLPTSIRGLDRSRIYESHLHDKKFIHRKNRFVLPVKIGCVKIAEGVPEAVIRGVIKEASG